MHLKKFRVYPPAILGIEKAKILKFERTSKIAMTRQEKFDKKTQGSVYKNRFDAQKEAMVKLEKIASQDLEKIELETKQFCQGEPITKIPYYLIFAKEIYSLKNRLTDKTLIQEASCQILITNEIVLLEHKNVSRTNAVEVGDPDLV